jgi:hypothetical protein
MKSPISKKCHKMGKGIGRDPKRLRTISLERFSAIGLAHQINTDMPE